MSKKSISRQKKMDTRIDFTPMVDMNMLLITFFMLCTTMLKSQTLKIALPTNNEESKTEQNQNQAAESQALTIIIDGVETNDEKTGARSNPDAKFYYYEGQLNLADPTSFKEAKGIGMGDTNDKSFLRGVLRDKNKEALKLIAEQKKLWQEHKFSKNDQANDSIYQLKAAEIRSRNDLHPPIVMIKPTGRASYSDVVALLDEMQINNISRFQIESLSKDDSTALANKGVQLPPVSANKK